MPPSRPSSAEDLIDVLRRAADAQLALSAAVNRHATATEKLLPSIEQLRHNVYDATQQREFDVANQQSVVNKINEHLAVLTAAVTRLPGDVTGAFKLAQAEEKTAVERIFSRLERSSVGMKVFVLILVVALCAASGIHLILSAVGG